MCIKKWKRFRSITRWELRWYITLHVSFILCLSRLFRNIDQVTSFAQRKTLFTCPFFWILTAHKATLYSILLLAEFLLTWYTLRGHLFCYAYFDLTPRLRVISCFWCFWSISNTLSVIFSKELHILLSGFRLCVWPCLVSMGVHSFDIHWIVLHLRKQLAKFCFWDILGGQIWGLKPSFLEILWLISLMLLEGWGTLWICQREKFIVTVFVCLILWIGKRCRYLWVVLLKLFLILWQLVIILL